MAIEKIYLILNTNRINEKCCNVNRKIYSTFGEFNRDLKFNKIIFEVPNFLNFEIRFVNAI